MLTVSVCLNTCYYQRNVSVGVEQQPGCLVVAVQIVV